MMEKYTLQSAMLRLKEITEALEKNEFDLDLSMKLYEEGVQLVSFCSNALNDAKQRIEELSEADAAQDNDDAF